MLDHTAQPGVQSNANTAHTAQALELTVLWYKRVWGSNSDADTLQDDTLYLKLSELIYFKKQLLTVIQASVNVKRFHSKNETPFKLKWIMAVLLYLNQVTDYKNLARMLFMIKLSAIY